jgi:hypothetical protein
MDEASARATLVDFADSASALLTTIPRHEVEEAVQTEDGPPDLILDVARFAGEGEAQTTETAKISVSWTREDLEELLRRSTGDSVTLAFDGEQLAAAFGGEVEAHGIREAAAIIAVAVTAGGAAGVAGAQPAEQAGTSASYTAIEQVRSEAAGPPSGVDIESVRTAAAAAARTSALEVDIEAVRSEEAASTAMAASVEAFQAAEAAAATPTVDIEAVRSEEAASLAMAASVEAFQAAEAATSLVDIEAVRSAEIAATATAAETVGIESVRSAAAEATREAADSGISVSVPNPETIGALAGGVALLIAGAAFALRGRKPLRPA